MSTYGLKLRLLDFFLQKNTTEEKPNFEIWKKIITNYCMSIWWSRVCTENKCYWTSEAYAFIWRGWPTLLSPFVCRQRFATIFLSSQKTKDSISPVIQYDNGNPGFFKPKRKLHKNISFGERKPQTCWEVKQDLECVTEQLKKPKFPLRLCTVNWSKNQTSSYNIHFNFKQLNLLYSGICVQVRHQSVHFPVSFWLLVGQKSILWACTFTAG